MLGADKKALFAKYCLDIWDQVFKSRLSKFFKGCHPQNILSPLIGLIWLHLLKQMFPEGPKLIFSAHCPAHLNCLWLFLTKKWK